MYLAQLGTINPPPGVLPVASGNPSSLVASIFRNGIMLFIIIAFAVAVITMILAGLKFITAGGDEKQVSAAWSQIYWGLIGLVVVVGAFAIIKLAETFFGLQIISSGFSLPR